MCACSIQGVYGGFTSSPPTYTYSGGFPCLVARASRGHARHVDLVERRQRRVGGEGGGEVEGENAYT